MTINEMKDKCSSEMTALIIKVFLLGRQEGFEEGKKTVDRYEEGFADGAIILKDALLDDDFLDMNYESRSPEDVLADFKAFNIIKDYREYSAKQQEIGEAWTKLETSNNGHKIRAKCQNCGYLMDWDDRTKYCPECGNHNMEE